MARKPLGFKPTLRQQRLASNSAQSFYAAMMPVDDPRRAENMQRLEQERAAIAPVRQRAAPRQLEAEVIKAVKQLLATHPKILWVLRVNAGMASYEAKSGKWAPVKFHEWLRSPMPMRMPDFFGMLVDGRCIALEAKKPDWTKPTDQREREQADFLQCIRAHGGIGAFVTSSESVANILKSC